MNLINMLFIRLLLTGIFFVEGLHVHSQQHSKAESTASVNVLAIGNAHYNESFFDSHDDINISATKFLNCFRGMGALRTIQSVGNKPLSKKKMLEAIQHFVEFVEAKDGRENIGIIYYCGHGISSLAGSMYFIPGDTDRGVEDSTFEYLSQQLLNVDEINQMIVHAQLKELSTTRYIIIGDCCSNQAVSKWYKGIGFHFQGDGDVVVSYDSCALHNSGSVNSVLSGTENLTFSGLADTSTTVADSTKPAIDEVDFIGEIIRSQTMKQKGDIVIWSSPVGETTELVTMPGGKKNSSTVGPVCRRTLLYQRKYSRIVLADYIKKLISPEFDKATTPALINRSRNSSN